MDRWLTLLTFQNAAEAHLIKTKLESADIQTFLKNEYTSQLVPHGSEPGGPVKLRVSEKDLDEAIKLLKETDYLKEETSQLPRSLWMKTLDNITAQIPFLRNQPSKLRLIIAVGILLATLALIVGIITLPEI
jgi:hypothetical protein